MPLVLAPGIVHGLDVVHVWPLLRLEVGHRLLLPRGFLARLLVLVPRRAEGRLHLGLIVHRGSALLLSFAPPF